MAPIKHIKMIGKFNGKIKGWMETILAIFFGGIFGILCFFIVMTYNDYVCIKKSNVVSKDKYSKKGKWITESDGKDWGNIYVYQLPYPEKK